MELSASFTRALLSGFDRAYADLVRTATRSTGSREEAGDLVHDTWLRLAEHARSAAGESAMRPAQSDAPRDATAYIAVMVQHMALDAQRRRQRHGRYLDLAAVREQLAPSHVPDVADSVMYRQALAVLESALAGLPERSRAAFIAHRVQGERQPEIAERFGVSLNTVERDLIQAHACIEDALHRWRGTLPGGAGARQAGRRRSLGALLGLAGAGVGGAVGWQQWQSYRDNHVQWQARWSSPRGQQGRHGLPDGSSLLLDASSSAQAQYFATRRHVELAQGAAFFDVARDVQRPFVVHARGVRVTVLGTRFGVEIAQAAGGRELVCVQVESGRVRVQSDGAEGISYELGVGQGLRMEGGVVTPTHGAPGDAASWRHGQLVFSGSTLGEALARLSRYAPFTLSATPEAARLPLSGRVSIGAAHAWVRALPRAMPVQVSRQPDGGLVVALR
ncbi:Probable RNA polymerase sigma factor fecI [Delftia tsuruhatensis]|uniref:sigma-70 family RNA polymerase sigma factor n=1 Tax=Delftia tsuruhatensis TaxID=180282 RepID=UPI001E7417B2|nr:sigma-70 family RNA polymerase sigma factor [Delftia tsuruhatensis]CAB5716252.1 Probable RNA polymerase sigma factor fecI [Delftia tsuruhatensis]CAC9686082.1 Probable RNA polymerase sigma factor fecI [Delftia tsuruhatensis]